MQRFLHQHNQRQASCTSSSSALFCSQIISQIAKVSISHYKEKKNNKASQTPPALGKLKQQKEKVVSTSSSSSSLPIFTPAFTTTTNSNTTNSSAKFLIDEETLTLLADAAKKSTSSSIATTIVCSPTTINHQEQSAEEELEKELEGNLATESAKIISPHKKKEKKIIRQHHHNHRNHEPNLSFGNYFSNNNHHNDDTGIIAVNENAQRQKAIFQIKRLFRKVFQLLNIEHQNFICQVESLSLSNSSSTWYSEPTLRTNSERFPPRFYSSAVVWRARRNVQIIFPEVRMRNPQSDAEAVAMSVAMMTIAKADDKNSLFRWMAESNEKFERFSVMMPESVEKKKAVNEEILFEDDENNLSTLILHPAPVGAILKISDFYTNQDVLLFSAKKNAAATSTSATTQTNNNREYTNHNNNTNKENTNVNHYIAPLNNFLLDKLDQLCDSTDLTMELQFFILKNKHHHHHHHHSKNSGKNINNNHNAQYFIRGVAIFKNAYSNLPRKSFVVERSTMDKVFTEITQKFETFVVEERSRECKIAELVEVTKSIKMYSSSSFSDDSRNFHDSRLESTYFVPNKNLQRKDDHDNCSVEFRDKFGNVRILSNKQQNDKITTTTSMEEKIDDLTDRLLLFSSHLSPTPSRLRNKLTSLKWLLDESLQEETQITISKNLGFNNSKNSESEFRINLELNNNNNKIIATSLLTQKNLIDSVVILFSEAVEKQQKKSQELINLLADMKNFVPVLSKIKFPFPETLHSYNPSIILQHFEFARSDTITKLLTTSNEENNSTSLTVVATDALSMTEKEIGFSKNDFENAYLEFCGFLFNRNPRSLKKNEDKNFVQKLLTTNQDWIVDKRNNKNKKEEDRKSESPSSSLAKTTLSKFISLSPAIAKIWIQLQAQRLIPFSSFVSGKNNIQVNSQTFSTHHNSNTIPTSLVDLLIAFNSKKSQKFSSPLALLTRTERNFSYWGWPSACHQLLAKLFANNNGSENPMPLHYERTDYLSNRDPFIRATTMKKMIIESLSRKLETTSKQENKHENNSKSGEALTKLPLIYDPKISSSRNLDEINKAKNEGAEEPQQQVEKNNNKSEIKRENNEKTAAESKNESEHDGAVIRIIFKSLPPKQEKSSTINLFETFSNFDFSSTNSLEWCGAATISSSTANDEDISSASSPTTGHLSKNPLTYWRILQPSSSSMTTTLESSNTYPLASAFELLFATSSSLTNLESSNFVFSTNQDESAAESNSLSSLEKILNEKNSSGQQQQEEVSLLFLFQHLCATWLNLTPQFVASIQIKDIFVEEQTTTKKTTTSKINEESNNNDHTPSQKRQTLKPLSVLNNKKRIYSYSVVTISLPSSTSSKSENIVCGVGKSRKLALEDALRGNFGACVIFPQNNSSSSQKFKVEVMNEQNASSFFKTLENNKLIAPTHELLIMYQLLIQLTSSAGCQNIPTVRAKMILKEENNKRKFGGMINEEVSQRLLENSQKSEKSDDKENEEKEEEDDDLETTNNDSSSSSIEYVNKYAKFTGRIEYFLPTMKLLNNTNYSSSSLSSSRFYHQGSRKFSSNWHRSHLHEFSHESMMEAAKFALLSALKAILVSGDEIKSDTQAGSLLTESASPSKNSNNHNNIEITNDEIIFHCENVKLFLPDDEKILSKNNIISDVWSPTFALRHSLGDSLHFTVTQVEPTNSENNVAVQDATESSSSSSSSTYKARCYMSQSYPTLNSFNTNFSSENFVVDVAHSTTVQLTPQAAIDDLLWKILNGPLREVEKTLVAMRKFKFFLQNPAVCCVMGWKEDDLKIEIIPDFESCSFDAKLVKKSNGEIFHKINSITTNNNSTKKFIRKSDVFSALIDEVVEKVLEEEPELQDLLESTCDRRKCFFDESSTQNDAFYQHMIHETNQKFLASSGSKNNRTLKFSLQHSLRNPHAYFSNSNTENEKNLLQILSDMISQFCGEKHANPIEFRMNNNNENQNETTISLFFFGKSVQDSIPANLPSIISALMNSTKKFLLISSSDKNDDNEKRILGQQLWRKFCMRRSYLVHKFFGHAGLLLINQHISATTLVENKMNTSQSSNSSSNSKSATYNNTTLFGGTFYSSQAAVSMTDDVNFLQKTPGIISSTENNDNASKNINLDLTSKDGMVNLVLAFCFGAKLKDRNLFQNTTSQVSNNVMKTTNQVESLKVDPEILFPFSVVENTNVTTNMMKPIKIFVDLNLLTERKQKYKNRVYSEFVKLFDEMLGTAEESFSSSSTSAPENNNASTQQNSQLLFSGRRLLCVFDEKEYSILSSAPKENLEFVKSTTPLSIAKNTSNNFKIPSPPLHVIAGANNALKKSAIEFGLSNLAENEMLMTQLQLIHADSLLSSLRNILAILFCCHHHENDDKEKDNFGTVRHCIRAKPSFISPNLLVDSERHNNTQNAILESADVQFGLFYCKDSNTPIPILPTLNFENNIIDTTKNPSSSEVFFSHPHRCRIPSPLIRKQIRFMRIAKLNKKEDPNNFCDEDDFLELDHIDYGPSLFRFYAATIYHLMNKNSDNDKEGNSEDFLQEIIRSIARRNEWSAKSKTKYNLQNATFASHALLEILYGSMSNSSMIHQNTLNFQIPVLLAANNNQQGAEIFYKNPSNSNIWGCCTNVNVDGFLGNSTTGSLSLSSSESSSSSSMTCVSYGFALRKNDSVTVACKEALSRHGFSEGSNLVSIVQSLDDKNMSFEILK